MIFYILLLTDTTGFTFRFHGDGWIGKYYGKPVKEEDSTRYNMDTSVWLSVNIYETHNLNFYIMYRDDLDMAKQVGNIVFDPYLSHYWISGGVYFWMNKFYINPYITHDCIHIIDRPLDSLVGAGIKVVFNRLKIRMGNSNDLMRLRELKDKRISYIMALETGFYPQSKIIDYLNTKGFYHYDLKVRSGLIIFMKHNSSLSLYGDFYWTKLTREEENIRYSLDYTLEFVKKSSYGYFRIFFKDFLLNTDPIKSPQGKKILGAGFGF